MIKYLVLLLLALNTLNAQTITGRIINTSLKGVGDDTELSSKAKIPFYYEYVYSKKESIQKLFNATESSIDTTYKVVDGNTLVTTKSILRPSDVTYYKNYNINVYNIDFSSSGKNYSIVDEIPSYKWILVNDTFTIAGFTVKKATTTAIKLGREQKITAWYCEDIPVNDGPLDFNGLPGLILQIEIDDTTKIYFETIKLIIDTTIEIPQPATKSSSISIKEYEKLMLNNN